MEKSDYIINNIYQGGYSTFDSEKSLSPINYPLSAGSFGLTTDPRSANVLKEVSSKLSSGVKQIEVEGVSPEVFESMPQQDLKEVNRLAKLTGVNVSVHGPIIEASGITQQGFTESNRQAVERQMNLAVERSHEINPDGSSPVTFHSSAILPGDIKEKGKKEAEETLVINTETGSINKIPLKKSNFPGEPAEININNVISKRNEESWRQALSHLAYNTERGSDIVENYAAISLLAEAEKKAGRELSQEEKRAQSVFNIGTAFLNDSYRELKDLYDIAFTNIQKKGTQEDLQKLRELESNISKKVEEINLTGDNVKNITLRKEIVEEGLQTLNKIQTPSMFEPLNDFAKTRTTETFANVALNSYKKFGDKSPIISIENPPAGGAFSTGEELREIVEKSREKFVKKAVEEGMSESVAKNQAEKLLGVTWDVGHINMLRKFGYEDKDIVKESEEIKPLLKHVHLSDNFGFEHTELPMGMGNVPIKEIMEKLGKEGFESKKIIEAASWWQHFQTPPVQETLEAFGSPIYAMQMAPYWNQSQGFQQGYFGGYGQMLPDINYQTFGAGFSQLPAELGGQKPGAGGGRMSGKPME